MSSSWTFKPIIDGLAQSRTLLNIQKLRNLRLASFDPHIPILDFILLNFPGIISSIFISYIISSIESPFPAPTSKQHPPAHHGPVFGTALLVPGTGAGRLVRLVRLALLDWRCRAHRPKMGIHQGWRSYPLVNIQKTNNRMLNPSINGGTHRHSYVSLLEAMYIYYCLSIYS